MRIFFDGQWQDRDQKIEVRNPYDATLVPNVPALLTYGDVPASLVGLADVLSGRERPRGVLPVRI